MTALGTGRRRRRPSRSDCERLCGRSVGCCRLTFGGVSNEWPASTACFAGALALGNDASVGPSKYRSVFSETCSIDSVADLVEQEASNVRIVSRRVLLTFSPSEMAGIVGRRTTTMRSAPHDGNAVRLSTPGRVQQKISVSSASSATTSRSRPGSASLKRSRLVPQGTTVIPNRSYVAASTGASAASTSCSVVSASEAGVKEEVRHARVGVDDCHVVAVGKRHPESDVLVVLPVPPFPLATANVSDHQCILSDLD